MASPTQSTENGLNVGLAIFHDEGDLNETLRGILTGCDSSSLHRLIDKIPRDRIPGGCSKTKLRKTIRYDDRFASPRARWRGFAGEPSNCWKDTMTLIIGNIPHKELLGTLLELNELGRYINLSEVRVLGAE